VPYTSFIQVKPKQILIALDQLVNTVLGGWADETLSSRAWRLRFKTPWIYKTIDSVFFWDTNHCEKSYVSERERRQLPPQFRL
jgi:hypothetical protein